MHYGVVDNKQSTNKELSLSLHTTLGSKKRTVCIRGTSTKSSPVWAVGEAGNAWDARTSL